MANDWAALKASIKRKLNQEAGDDTGNWTDAEYLAEANFIMREVVDRTGCLRSSYTDSTVSAQTYYDKQSDFGEMIKVYFVSSDGQVPLEKTSIAELDGLEDDGVFDSPWRAKTGDPVAWFHSDEDPDKYGLYPQPITNGSSDLIAVYRDQATEMTVGTSVPFNGVKDLYDYHKLIMYGVVIEFKDIDGENSSKQERRYEAGIRNLKKKMAHKYTMLSFGLAPRSSSTKRSPDWGLGL